MPWGVYEGNNRIDVAPCDNDGNVTEGHDIDGSCYCLPEEESGDGGQLIVIHNSVN
jgi:hypothetical protein